MKSSKSIYTEKDRFVVKYCHPKSDDYLHYKSIIDIKPGNKLPIELKIIFDGIPPFAAPFPPKEYQFKAATIIGLHLKMAKWFKRYGYLF